MVIANADRMAVRALRRFSIEYRRKHCPVGKEVDPEKKENEPWRRISGITADIEACMDVKERRSGIRALIRWIEAYVRADLWAAKAAAERIRSGVGEYLFESREESERSGALECDDLNQVRCDSCSGQCNPASCSLRSPSPLGWATRDGEDEDETAWACEGQSVELVLRVCEALNISRNKLSALIKEVRGICATELIDGFRMGAVKRLLAERVRFHARELWLEPGLYVGVRVMDEGLRVHGGGTSAYYAEPDPQWRRKELGEDRKERLEQLIRAYDAGWKRGEQARDGFAAALGFRKFSELNRACLNVFGKTARQIAYAICRDVVEYYLAKEMEELRELAAAEPVSAAGARARWLYSGTGGRPGAGASLLWASQDAAWLAKMGGWLERG